jgi:hypothetical protein
MIPNKRNNIDISRHCNPARPKAYQATRPNVEVLCGGGIENGAAEEVLGDNCCCCIRSNSFLLDKNVLLSKRIPSMCISVS